MANPGQNIARLATSVAGMDREDISTSRQAWVKGAASLGSVSEALEAAAGKVLAGFGEESGVGEAAQQVLLKLKTDTVDPRRDDMVRASTALTQVQVQMAASEAINTGMPDSAPGPMPTYQGTTGETHEDIQALKIHANAVKRHNDAVAAYGNADETARLQVHNLNETYHEAAKVMAEIHGEPIPERRVPGPEGGGSGGGGSATPPTPTPPTGFPPRTPPQPPVSPPVHPPVHPPVNPPIEHPISQPPTTQPPVILTPQPPETPVSPVPGTEIDWDNPVPGTPSSDPGGDSGSGSGGGFPTSAALGAAGAGVLGGLGARSAAAAIGSYVGRGPSAGVVGASSRASASGVLGRGGAVGGQAVGRGGAAGAGGRGTGVGGSGTRGAGGRGAGGRGAGGRGAGGRGAAGAGAGGRGRGKKDAEQGREADYEVDEDWTDDEGSPSVLS